MYKKLMQIIKENFNIEVINVEVISDHFQSKVYLIESHMDKYVLKEIGSEAFGNPENEGELTEYLNSNGIKVPKIFKTNNGEFIFHDDNNRCILQDFIVGKQFALNTAPDWFLIKSAEILGKIQNILKGYKKLPLEFGESFLSKETVLRNEQSVLVQIKKAEEENNIALITALRERLKHISRISCFEFDCSKLTYTNSHGDFYTNQIIVQNKVLVIIDWTSAFYLPACFEVMMSYTYADPACKDGIINIERFTPYLNEYLKYFSLNSHDIKMMPYFTYYYLCFCNFMPPYDDLPNDFLQIARLGDNLMNWLYENVDVLSNDLCR